VSFSFLLKVPQFNEIILLLSEIKDIVQTFGSHLNTDLQQRGVEFSQLFGSHNHLRESLLEKMPAMTINKMNGSNGNGESEITEIHMPIEKAAASNGRSNTDTLLDLLGSGDDIITMSTPSVVPSNTTPAAATSNLLDLLGDIDLSAPSVPVMMSNNNNNNLTSPPTLASPILDDNENRNIPDVMNGGSLAGNYDLGGLDFLAPATSTLTSTARVVTALDKNDLLVQLATVTQSDHLQIIMTTTNNSLDTLEDYLFQVSLLICDFFCRVTYLL
jgi:AP-1 complex subunit gamma-1